MRARATAAAMRRLRRERGWRLQDVAKLAGCDPSAVSRWESGAHKAPAVSRVAQVFGITELEALAPCPRCGYRPPPGYMCLACGTKGIEES